MPFMNVYRLHQRTIFICRRNDPCLPAHRRYGRQRPHVFPDNFLFPVRQVILFEGIVQCNTRVKKTMQLQRIYFMWLMPIIEKIVMKQGSPDQFLPVAGNVEFIAESHTVPCHIQHMLLHRHIAVLDVLPGSAEICRV